MSDYTPTPTALPGTVQVPADGEDPTGAILGGPHETAFDAIEYLMRRVAPAASSVGASPIFRTYGSVGHALDNAENAPGAQVVENTTTAGSISDRADMMFEIWPPNGSTLNGVTVYIDGAGSTLPAALPTVYLLEYDTTTGVVTTIGSQVDAVASGAAWDARHAVAISGLSHVVDRTVKTYRVRVVGHHNSGGGALTAGTTFSPPFVALTPSVLDQGAG